jgi:hypothetical protein
VFDDAWLGFSSSAGDKDTGGSVARTAHIRSTQTLLLGRSPWSPLTIRKVVGKADFYRWYLSPSCLMVSGKRVIFRDGQRTTFGNDFQRQEERWPRDGLAFEIDSDFGNSKNSKKKKQLRG